MRDFFYNKGDVLIAILIIVVAAIVIFFRVGIVMGDNDPGERLRNLFSPGNISGLFQGNGDDVEEGDEGTQEIVTAPPVDTDEQPPAVIDTEPEQTPEQPKEETPIVQEESPPEQPPAATGDLKITISAGDAASTIADKLFDVGAITDKQAFLSEVLAQKADSKLKQGTFTIPAGSTIGDIIKILVG